jgi:hypothetical protein
MRYFDPSDEAPAKIGKIIGDGLAILTYLLVIALMLVPLLR